MVSSVDYTESSPNIFQSPSASTPTTVLMEEPNENSSSSSSSSSLEERFKAATPVPTTVPSIYDPSQQSASEASFLDKDTSTGSVLDILGVLKYFLLALFVTSTSFWMFIWYRNHQYLKRIEETRLAMVEERQKRREKRRRRDEDNDIIVTSLEEIFEYHAETEGVILDAGGEEEEESESEPSVIMMDEEIFHDSINSNMDPTRRHEEIIKRFYFQTVLSDNTLTSETDIRPSCHDEENPKATNLESSTPSTSTEESASTGNSEGDIQPTSATGEWFQSWRKNLASAPKHQPCCICLEDYAKGETICVPITKRCNHFWHEECMVAWLEKHNDCPLCRVDLMENEEDNDANSLPARGR